MGDGLLTLIILAGITVFLVLRLKNVLGAKTGLEKKPEPVFGARRTAEAEPRVEDREEPEPIAANDPLAETWAAFRAIEPDFSPRDFVEGAKRAYEMLLMAYENGEKAVLETYLSPDVYQDFAAAIDQRANEGLTVDARFVGVREAKITGARFDADEQIAEIDLRFVGELVTVVRDQEHRVVEGDPNEIRRETDHWTFGRKLGAPDPNWLLIATGE
ncbi:Tim44 domain-containing protein [Pikeienuella piscinae]|uniref:Tim44 domain-containing protein n=1 Tax=Pikeienuella piscinae TaxID=2748098 RepID=A0A7L5BXX9_9RHOB|nr:Tim44/TimA family putative adaptor protein [Pikeienuella piscinae]QIE56301.1 Tim44 domain-containing protein [Pikeienuella piscinae]